MRQTVVSALGKELIYFHGVGQPGLSAADATRDLLGRFAGALERQGLALENTVHTRLFSADRPGRDQGTAVRRELLDGPARSTSSSFIAPALLDGRAVVAMDLVALRPSQPGLQKTLREYDPPRAPLRYLVYDGLVYLSGVTYPGATLAEQVAAALAELTETLGLAGVSWERALAVTCFLHSSEAVATLQRLVRPIVPAPTVPITCDPVEGFASEGRLIEIEVVAALG
jgi:enamine deaminase RidA (YjgF/YER057c/UK114 family)